MTTYTFKGDFSRTTFMWTDATAWQGGVVPNSPDADVVFPVITNQSTGKLYVPFVFVKGIEVNSVDIEDASLEITGSLKVDGDFKSIDTVLISNGTLTTDTAEFKGPDVYGRGTINVAKAFTNQATTTIHGGITLNLTAFDNLGTIGDGVTVNVTPGGFTNLTGTTLTGGNYFSQSAALSINAGASIETDAAHITLAGGDLFSAGNAIEKTLKTIAAGGSLDVSPTRNASGWGPLDIHGTLGFGDGFFAQQLTVESDGVVFAGTTLNTPMIDNGAVYAGYIYDFGSYKQDFNLLILTGPVSGTGKLVIAAEAIGAQPQSGMTPQNTLELRTPVALEVDFADGTGTLRLDDPSQFTGAISTSGNGDRILLDGISVDDISSASYSGTSAGGTLSFVDAGQTTTINFLGQHRLSDFQFTAGPKSLSSSPQLEIIENSDSQYAVTFTRLTVGKNGMITFSGAVTAHTASKVSVYNGTTLLGAATVNSATGVWTLNVVPPAGTYKALTAVATNLNGTTASASPSFALVAGIGGQPYTTIVNTLANAGGPTTARAYYNADGSLYEGLTVSTVAGNTLYTFKGGSYFAGKPFSSTVNTYGSGGQLRSIAYAGVTGQAYTSYLSDFDGTGHITDQKHFGYSGRPYTSDIVTYASDGSISGLIQYKGPSVYLAEKISTSASGVLSNLFYAGSAIAGRPYTSYENDYKGGRLIEQQFLGIRNQAYSSYAYLYDDAGHVASQQTNFTNGTHALQAFEAGATLTSVQTDAMRSTQASTTFLFNTGYGHDTITGFAGQLAGSGHDTLSVARAEFADVATLLAHTQTSGANAIITGAGPDTITLVGVTKAMLMAHQDDIMVHA